MNVELLKELLLIAIANSVVMTLFIQKIKETFNTSNKSTVLLSFLLNMVIGCLLLYLLVMYHLLIQYG